MEQFLFKKDPTTGEEIAVKTREYADYQKQVILEARIKKANLPTSIKDYKISSYIGEDKDGNLKKIDKYIAEFATKFNKVHLYLYSKENSTQKTTIACYIAKCLLKREYKCKFILMSDLVNMLKNKDFEEEPNEELQLLEDCDFLIIDDSFDCKKTTIYKSEFQLAFIDTFLRKRLEVLNKATCFTSNFMIEEIELKFGISIKKLIERKVSVLNFADSIYLKDTFDGSIWD